MSIEKIEIGSAPCEESCAQVGTPDYSERAYAECEAFKAQLYRYLASKGHAKESLPESFRLCIKSSSHDFGSYYEVVAKFDDSDEKAWDIALLLENESPTHWDEEAKKALNLN